MVSAAVTDVHIKSATMADRLAVALAAQHVATDKQITIASDCQAAVSSELTPLQEGAHHKNMAGGWGQSGGGHSKS